MLRVMWGDPPKPNIWKATVKHNNDLQKTTYFVHSPVLRQTSPIHLVLEKKGDSGELTLVSVYGGQEGTYASAWKEIVYVPTQDLNGGEAVLSRPFWSIVKRMLVKHNALKDPNKVASTKPILQWGNPPKPNLWKASIDRVEMSLTVDSPILEKPMRFIAKALQRQVFGGVKYLRIEAQIMDRDSYLWSLENYYYSEVVEFKSPISVENAFKIWVEAFKRQDGWEEVKKLGIVKLKKGLKVASSDQPITLLWGNPPKPNLWKASFVPFSNSLMIDSPLLEQAIRLKGNLSMPYGGIPFRYLEVSAYLKQSDHFWKKETVWRSELAKFPMDINLSDAFKIWADKVRRQDGWEEIKRAGVIKLKKGVKVASELP